jgi:hypothetical protein
MSRARHKEEHKKRAEGGSVKPDWNAGEEQNAAKEAMEKKKGGRVKHMKGEGEEPKHRSDRPSRAKGGRVRGKGAGADKHPLTEASKVKHVTEGEGPEEGVPSD